MLSRASRLLVQSKRVLLPKVAPALVCSAGVASVSPEDTVDTLEDAVYRVKPERVKRIGVDLLNDMWFNKATGFPLEERDRLGIRGLLPPRVTDMQQQVERFREHFNELDDDLEKWKLVSSLQDRSETVFYQFVLSDIKNIAPIIYTPTVGKACQQFSALFRRRRGMYFSAIDRGNMSAMIYNWPADDVDVIVVTDGSRVLGLGDLGVHGMAISIGKLSLYCAGGGIHPQRVLPVCLDVGTDNENLRNDPSYLGLARPRLTGDEYYDVVDEFIRSVRFRYPNVLIQFEDFQNAHARTILDKYRNNVKCFNDDIQGTGATALAGLMSALRSAYFRAKANNFANVFGGSTDAASLPTPKANGQLPLEDQTYVVLGAGSAGLGVVDAICNRMIDEGVDPKKARERFFLVDHMGLLGTGRTDLTEDQMSYQRKDMPGGMQLVDVIKQAKPSVLLGLAGVGGLFNKEALKAVHEANPVFPPVIFPMSNPTANAECTATEAFEATDGRCIFASGSPFDPVTIERDGVKIACNTNQSNNMYIFPGLGLGTLFSGAKIVTDGMIQAAAHELSELPNEAQLKKGIIYPGVENIRLVSRKVAMAVTKAALVDNVIPEDDAKHVEKLIAEDMLEKEIFHEMYQPAFAPLYHHLID